TSIPGDENRLSLFEGYMAYLRWRQDNPDFPDTVIVLNPVNLLESALTKLTSVSILDAYLDRDSAGEAAMDRLLMAMLNATNRSDVYEGFKDYTEMLMARPPQNILYDEEHIYEKVPSTYRR